MVKNGCVSIVVILRWFMQHVGKNVSMSSHDTPFYLEGMVKNSGCVFIVMILRWFMQHVGKNVSMSSHDALFYLEGMVKNSGCVIIVMILRWFMEHVGKNILCLPMMHHDFVLCHFLCGGVCEVPEHDKYFHVLG